MRRRFTLRFRKVLKLWRSLFLVFSICQILWWFHLRKIFFRTNFLKIEKFINIPSRDITLSLVNNKYLITISHFDENLLHCIIFGWANMSARTFWNNFLLLHFHHINKLPQHITESKIFQWFITWFITFFSYFSIFLRILRWFMDPMIFEN